MHSIHRICIKFSYELFSDDVIEADSGDLPELVLPDQLAVRFASSDVNTHWVSSVQTLLELAESQGLSPAFSCRSGRCGMCSTKILSGKVQYTRAIATALNPEYALICCSVPLGEETLVLDV